MMMVLCGHDRPARRCISTTATSPTYGRPPPARSRRHLARREVPQSPACSAPACRRGSRSRHSRWCGRSSGSWCGRAMPAGQALPPMSGRLGLDVLPVGSAERLVLEADVVVTATARHAARGRRLAASGAARHRDGLRCRGQERAPSAVLGRADRLVCDRRPVRAPGRAAPHALAAPSSRRSSSARSPPAASLAAGRREITVCDLTGTGSWTPRSLCSPISKASAADSAP